MGTAYGESDATHRTTAPNHTHTHKHTHTHTHTHTHDAHTHTHTHTRRTQCVLFLQYSLLPSPDGYGQLMASFLVFGFFILPLLPLTFECAVEATFPVRAETTTGVLMGFGNLMGFALIEILNALLPSQTNDGGGGGGSNSSSSSSRSSNNDNCSSAWEPWLVVLFVFGVVAALSVQLFRGERRREKVDSEAEAMAAAGHGRAGGSLRLEPRK